MMGALIFSFLLTIATFLMTSFATPSGHPFTPRERVPSPWKQKEEDRILCEINCELPGKYPFCGKDGCQYTGLMQKNCLEQKCGYTIERDYKGNCNKPAPVYANCPVRPKGRKHPGRPKKPPLPSY